jgi:hypothetical protein
MLVSKTRQGSVNMALIFCSVFLHAGRCMRIQHASDPFIFMLTTAECIPLFIRGFGLLAQGRSMARISASCSCNLDAHLRYIGAHMFGSLSAGVAVFFQITGHDICIRFLATVDEFCPSAWDVS